MSDTMNHEAGPPTMLAVPVNHSDHFLGSHTARVTVVEYGDFECPACGQAYPAVKMMLNHFGDRLRFVYRHFPQREVHPHAELAAEAAEAAGAQHKFWPMHDRLFQAQDEWNGEATDAPKAFFKRYAGELGLDVAKWETCFDARKYQPRINSNLADGLRRGVNSTPTFIIGNKVYDIEKEPRPGDEVRFETHSTSYIGASL